MLILFDIDGTILLTGGEGIKAFEDAGKELYGGHFTLDGVDFSGRLDALIWNDLLQRNKVPEHLHHEQTFRDAYGRHLHARLRPPHITRLLPGVRDLVERLHADAAVTLGLLTGNYPETGRLKVQSAGLDPELFPVAAWGCEGKIRRDLPPVAIQRYQHHTGRRVAAGEVIIIGDTPHDVDCARHSGCRSIAVATGAFKVDQLRASGADLAVENLADTARLMRWILEARVPAMH